MISQRKTRDEFSRREILAGQRERMAILHVRRGAMQDIP
jgi:hypothetical protein